MEMLEGWSGPSDQTYVVTISFKNSVWRSAPALYSSTPTPTHEWCNYAVGVAKFAVSYTLGNSLPHRGRGPYFDGSGFHHCKSPSWFLFPTRDVNPCYMAEKWLGKTLIINAKIEQQAVDSQGGIRGRWARITRLVQVGVEMLRRKGKLVFWRGRAGRRRAESKGMEWMLWSLLLWRLRLLRASSRFRWLGCRWKRCQWVKML